MKSFIYNKYSKYSKYIKYNKFNKFNNINNSINNSINTNINTNINTSFNSNINSNVNNNINSNINSGVVNSNINIKFDLIKLVNYNSVYLGIFRFIDAFYISLNMNLDLIEISNNYNSYLSICKLIRYGRFQYIKNKKNNKIKNIKKKLIKKKIDKEMSFSLFIDNQDYFNKISKIKKFLLSFLNVRVFIIVKGRMRTKLNLIIDLLERIKFDLYDYNFLLNGSLNDINNQFYLYFYNSKNVQKK